eukprot:GFKZ01000540.1.p1 GENE.GFKZ01000540.1~~GFKZ01000540.1.p1  ORF type:complete len:378 (+),score=44.68 GFKZ01000540.1:123-1256(+)
MVSSAGQLWEDFPLFAPEGVQIPKLDEEESANGVSPALGALSHLLYDEETPLEASELLRDEGNRHFKRGRRGYKNAINKYNQAILAAGDVPEALAPALLNRAMAEFKLQNYGKSLQDVNRSLSVLPRNVKAHYRALLCAIELEKFDIASRHCEAGLELCISDDSAQGRRDRALFKLQKKNLEKAIEKSHKYEKAKDVRRKEEQLRKQKISQMVEGRGITMGLPLFSQQRRYSTTEPSERDGEWYWPVLLVYPEEVACAGQGDQSDFLEDVSENTSMGDVLRWVFGVNSSGPEWDVNRFYTSAGDLEVRYRLQWTMELADADSEDEEYFCGSSLPADEIGSWISVASGVRLCELMRRRNYITPLFPVLYVVPKHIELR